MSRLAHSRIDQSKDRDFRGRLTDFSDELRLFLEEVWMRKSLIDLDNHKEATNYIYCLYAGPGNYAPDADPLVLDEFTSRLMFIAGSNLVACQDMEPKMLSEYTFGDIMRKRHKLWKTFYHVLNGANGGAGVTKRVYVHTANWKSSLEVIKLFVGQFAKLPGLKEVKTAGPGASRYDSILAYVDDTESRTAIVSMLKEDAQRNPQRYADGVPLLAKKEERGIGTADEPPKMRVVSGGDERHSYGSFFADLIWLALRSTLRPSAAERGWQELQGALNKCVPVDPRHFLDYMLYNLRLLRIDPKNPSEIPDKGTLESWYRANAVLNG
jgi:hypothetical protein